MFAIAKKAKESRGKKSKTKKGLIELNLIVDLNKTQIESNQLVKVKIASRGLVAITRARAREQRLALHVHFSGRDHVINKVFD